MSKEHEILAGTLRARLDELVGRAGAIEDDLRHELDQDWSEQAIDLADDEALAGVDAVLLHEITEIRGALMRLANGSYGTCGRCGEAIAPGRLQAHPAATQCVSCAG